MPQRGDVWVVETDLSSSEARNRWTAVLQPSGSFPQPASPRLWWWSLAGVYQAAGLPPSPLCYAPRASAIHACSHRLLTWMGDTVHSTKAHSSSFMNYTINGFVLSVFFSQVLFSFSSTTSFVKPQLPLAPGDLLQHHQPWVAPLSFSGCGEGYVQHIQCPPQHTHWDGRITPRNVAAQYDKCAHPFAGLSQRPWREVRPLSQLIISNCPNKLGT